MYSVYIDDDSKLDLVKGLIDETNIIYTDFIEGSVVRSDVILLLFSFSGQSLLPIIEAHPYNKIIIYGPFEIYRNNIKYVKDLDELCGLLKVLNRRKTITSIASEGHPLVRKKKRKLRKVKCDFCGKEVGNTKLALDKHQEFCQRFLSRPVCYGHLYTFRRQSGKSKGSYLVVNIPVSVSIEARHFKPGLHLVTDGKLIKFINSAFKDIFKYILVKEEEL